METGLPAGPADASIRFLLRLGRALHAYGYSADQLERALTASAARLGLEAQFFSTPTSMNNTVTPSGTAGFSPAGSQLARVRSENT